jgi:phospholipid transport system substrate-binding protein
MTRDGINRRTLLGASLVWAAAGLRPSLAADDAAILAPIQRLVSGLLEIMKAGRSTPFEQRFGILGPVVDQAFDLQVVLEESVGPAWQNLAPDMQSPLEAAFRRYTVASYVNSFDSFNGQQFTVEPNTRAVGNGEQIVQTRIIPKSGEGHELDYVMRSVRSGWKAVDVLADGAVSRVAVQRSDFRRLLARGGAPALLAQLQQKVADLSGGANG